MAGAPGFVVAVCQVMCGRGHPNFLRRPGIVVISLSLIQRLVILGKHRFLSGIINVPAPQQSTCPIIANAEEPDEHESEYRHRQKRHSIWFRE